MKRADFLPSVVSWRIARPAETTLGGIKNGFFNIDEKVVNPAYADVLGVEIFDDGEGLHVLSWAGAFSFHNIAK